MPSGIWEYQGWEKSKNPQVDKGKKMCMEEWGKLSWTSHHLAL